MSGHSKWSTIKHKKAAIDAKRGKTFSRIAKEIIVAARLGGGDAESNPRLRLALMKAREANMPKDNVEKNILKGTGELPGVTYEEVIMEAYGPGGVAILIEGLTDNKNRTAAELRSLLNKNGGNSAGAGSVSYIFERKGLIVMDAAKVSEDKVMEVVLDAGAEDIKNEDGQLFVYTPPQAFEAVKKAVLAAALPTVSSEITSVPTTTVPVTDPAQAKQVLHLMEVLEDYDDVQQVFANFDIPDALMGGE